MIDISKTYSTAPNNFFLRDPLSFTIHSRERMAEYGINDAFVENIWQRSKEKFIPKNLKYKKLKKYGEVELNVKIYTRNGYEMTVNVKKKPPLLITITKIKSGNIPLIVNHPQK